MMSMDQENKILPGTQHGYSMQLVL